jgi:predicted RNA binding protein YcfA (HicA-like mRNA interferase family)
MVKLPIASGSKVIHALQRIGFEIVGQKGSHVRLKKKTSKETRIAIVPIHDELTPGTLLSIIRQSGLTKEELIGLIK